MITVVNAPGDQELAARLRADLQAAGYTVGETVPPGNDAVLVVVLSPEANANAQVEQALIAALDNGQHILPVLAQPAPLPKLIDHLSALDFTDSYDAEALRQTVAALTAPGTRKPLKVITPQVRQSNRKAGIWLGALAIVWFVIALIMVGVFRVQAPLEEYNAVATFEYATIQVELARNQPRSTVEAQNFVTTVQAAPTAQRPLLIATATALVTTPERRRP